jgi:glycosyltransferase involved in cell wall biosynthesis
MLLLDALYINNSGGKVLLDYMVDSLEARKADVFYYLDERCRQNYSQVSANKKLFAKGSLSGRRGFYASNRNRFSGALCFGNIPPPVAINGLVLTYLHQPLYLEQPSGTPLLKRLHLMLKAYVIRSFQKNTDYWAVQSDNIAGLMRSKWNVGEERIKIMPFYPEIDICDPAPRSDDNYLFVSNGNPHKNHYRLIEAFARFNREHPEATLHFTVSERYAELLQHIATHKRRGIRIVNHGILPRQELCQLYKSCAFLVYPSLAESFGLGLIEAIDLGCKVIAADLPYVHAVCKPTLVFDPLNTNSIYSALIKSRSGKLTPSVLTVRNCINDIFNLFHL